MYVFDTYEDVGERGAERESEDAGASPRKRVIYMCIGGDHDFCYSVLTDV